MAFSSQSPARPSIELLSSSASTGMGVGGGGGAGAGGDEGGAGDDGGESVEALMTKLAIEKRVQYGAEKMLDVIEQRAATGDGTEQEQVKERIMAQLEAANEHIKLLESRLERVRGGAGTPQRPRRRPQQPRLNGYASTSSLGQGLSCSLSSSNVLSSGGARPRIARGGTSPASSSRQGTPARSSRPRSQSAGEDALDFGAGAAKSRLGWVPQVASSSPQAMGQTRELGQGGQGQGQEENEGQDVEGMLQAVEGILRHLKRSRDEGKGKEREREYGERGDEVWEGVRRLGEMLKRSEGVREGVDRDDLLASLLPLLSDGSTPRRRAVAYRVLRYALTREAWGQMLNAGLEWLLVRTFTRDSKAASEKEQALRLIRSIVTLPPPPPSPAPPSFRHSTMMTQSPSSTHSRPPSSTQAPLSPSRSSHGRPRRSSRQGHSRRHSNNNDHDSPVEPQPFAAILARRVPLTDGLVRALVSIAENPDDALRVACMETLVEIGLHDLPCLIRSDALRTILLSLKDGPFELGPAITGSLMYMANTPSARQLLVPGSDLETVLVDLTEQHGKVPARQHARHVERLQACARNISMLLSSWPGLLYLCMDDCRAIKSLVSTLHSPVVEVRDAMLDLVFSTLRIRTPSWINAFLEGKRLTVYNRTQEATSQLVEGEEEDDIPQGLNLVDHYIALLLAVFIENGLVESLVALVEEDPTTINRKATLALGEVLQMANRLLPLKYAAQLQSLPRLFEGATEFSNPHDRHAALSALSSIDSLNRNRSKAQTQAIRAQSGGYMQDSLERGQKQVQQVKLRLGLQIEDKTFQQMINDSGVLLGRDHTKWNYDIITELIEGPLLNPKRLDEAIKATKFMRRLFSFFHPFNNRFSSIKRTRPNHKWVRLGCSMISTMLVNPEGTRFLIEDKLLRQMVECFMELDQYIGTPNAQPVLARDRIENSLTYGYFEMIGTLSKHREGVKLLERFRFFTCFYHLSEQRSRDDIIRIIIECFDYTIDAHPRIVLSKALTSSYMETRLFATHHLGRLLHEAPALTDWALQLMITQLYDTSMEVCDVAVMYLEDMCGDAECLEKVVQLRPTLEHLGDIGYPLFMRFISTSIGFQYLYQAQYVERELDSWLAERNLLYVIEAETFVTKTLRPFTSDTVEDYWVYEGTAPTHFFGELTKTPEGCQLLRERGIVSDLAEVVRLHGMEGEDQALLTSVKSALWALGNIGSTQNGLPFLEDEEIIEVIVEVAEQSPVLTMRGTCFFVLGLLSSTRMGAEVLEEFGWIATRTALGMTTGLCLPNDIARFVRIEPWDRQDLGVDKPTLPKLHGVEGEIMNAIGNLSNYVLAAGAMNNLKRTRARHPKYFSSLSLFHRALHTISSNHYQAPVRRFILDLFDVRLTPDVLGQLRHLHNAATSSNGVNGTANGHSNELVELRRRSASSPGPGLVPGPASMPSRTRGLTVSGMSAIESPRAGLSREGDRPVSSSLFGAGGGRTLG